MQRVEFYAVCPFELGDKVKFIINEKREVYSESYTISDILAIHSAKTGKVTFKIVIKNKFDQELVPVDMEDLVIAN